MKLNPNTKDFLTEWSLRAVYYPIMKCRGKKMSKCFTVYGYYQIKISEDLSWQQGNIQSNHFQWSPSYLFWSFASIILIYVDNLTNSFCVSQSEISENLIRAPKKLPFLSHQKWCIPSFRKHFKHIFNFIILVCHHGYIS